ncbi:MAG TPA: hypothetical protein PLP34_09865 [Chitinophagaceae bacterium]|nr:hypothetical protein [Chitinophagaceae bacterium]
MNAICIDDDYLNNELLITLLKRYCPGVRMIATGGSVEDALTLIATHQPDLIFSGYGIARYDG